MSEKSFCPNCGAQAIREGDKIICENCDAVFKVTSEGARAQKQGILADINERLSRLEKGLIEQPKKDDIKTDDNDEDILPV